MHRVERFGIGTRIDSLFLELLETIRKSEFAKPEDKIEILETVNMIIDSLRFFVQLAWEATLLQDTSYIALGEKIESMGRQTGSWKRGLIAKTSPANTAREEK